MKEHIKKATICIEHTPGLSAQIDWKEDMRLISYQGEVILFNTFLYVLPYSKKKFIALTFDCKQDTLFAFLNDTFYHTGGVPEKIWFDNMRPWLTNRERNFQRFY